MIGLNKIILLILFMHENRMIRDDTYNKNMADGVSVFKGNINRASRNINMIPTLR